MNITNSDTVLVMSPNNIDYETISDIKKLLFDTYDHSDFGVLNDFTFALDNHEICLLPTYYLRFHGGPVVFISLDDYLEHRMQLISNNIFLYLESLPDNTDRNQINNVKLIAKTSDGLKVISNELSRTL